MRTQVAIIEEKDGVIICEGPRALLVQLYGQDAVQPHPLHEEWGWVALDERRYKEAA